jgi:DNA-binding beta-propeller fold protein YncE
METLSYNRRLLTTLKVTVGAALVICAVVLLPRANVHAQASAFANFEGAQTNPIRMSADGTRLFAVNTPNQTLSVFDLTVPTSPKLIAEIPVGLEPVSVNPTSDDIAWVVNQVSNSISIVSVSKGIVTASIEAQIEPMDVVFAGGLAYVSASRSNEILVFNQTTFAQVATIPLFGDNPRALAVSPDGSKVYVAFALSGNATTILGDNLAPPQSPPVNPALPPPPQVGLIIKYNDPTYSKDIKFSMPDNDVAIINTGATPTLAGYYSGVGTVNLGIAVNPVTGDLYVSNTDSLNLTHFETNLVGHFVNNRITEIQASSGTITPYDLNPDINYSILPNPAALATALAQPTGLAFDPSGDFMWVAAFGTDRVAQVSTSGNVLGFVEVAQPSGQGSNVDPVNKRGPRGLALNSAAKTLYVLNRITNSISILSTSQLTELSEIPIGFNPTPTAIQQGRGFLYDAKLSGSGTGACAACHIDGDMDHLAWDLGDPTQSMTTLTEDANAQRSGFGTAKTITVKFHPMKGPMTTQTLRGLVDQSPYHWRGDHANFAAFNTAFTSLLGGPELSTADMNLYTNFINTMLFLPNPYENLDRTLPTSLAFAQHGNAVNGLADFANVVETKCPSPTATCLLTCNACHLASPSGPGSNRFVSPAAPQFLKNPHLRNIYQKLLFTPDAGSTIDGFGMDHDGHLGTRDGAAPFFGGTAFEGYTAQQKADMNAYLVSFDTGTAPAVGSTRTLTKINVTKSPTQQYWTVLQSQAAIPNIDLVVRGTLNGQVHGLLYQPTAGTYISDTGTLYTQAQLQTLVLAGDTLSIMGVYPGTGSAIVGTILPAAQPAAKRLRQASTKLLAHR